MPSLQLAGGPLPATPDHGIGSSILPGVVLQSLLRLDNCINESSTICRFRRSSSAPGHLDAARRAIPTLLSTGGQDAVVADRLISGAYVRDFAAEYHQCGLKDAPWAVGAGVTLLWLLLIWVRRGRDGLYTTLGADGPTKAVIRTTEGLALMGSSAFAATAVAFGVLTVVGADLAAIAGGAGRRVSSVFAASRQILSRCGGLPSSSTHFANCVLPCETWSSRRRPWLSQSWLSSADGRW